MMDSSKSPGALYAELGYGLFQARRYQEAAEALHKALAEQASDFPRVNVYLTLGKVYSALSKDKEALEAFSKALRLDPDAFQEAKEEKGSEADSRGTDRRICCTKSLGLAKILPLPLVLRIITHLPGYSFLLDR
jgi:tetratricopeptide (TPR) repeat protein